jgi:hypothetical protein
MGYELWVIWVMGYEMNIKEQRTYQNRTVPG